MAEAMMQDLLHPQTSLTPPGIMPVTAVPGCCKATRDRQLHRIARGGQHHQTRLPCEHALTYLYKRCIDPVAPCLVLYPYQFS